MSAKEKPRFDLVKHRQKILSAYRHGQTEVVIDGRTFSYHRTDHEVIVKGKRLKESWLVVHEVGGDIVPMASFALHKHLRSQVKGPND